MAAVLSGSASILRRQHYVGYKVPRSTIHLDRGYENQGNRAPAPLFQLYCYLLMVPRLLDSCPITLESASLISPYHTNIELVMVKYSRLSTQLKELRLLYLLPGKPRDLIKCTLHTFPLDYAPKYESLSYVWGDPNVKKSIMIDGSPFQVTVDLKDALTRFRRRHKHRILWVC